MVDENILRKLRKVRVKPWSCEFEVVDEDWLFKLLHFKSDAGLRTPLLIVYAFINRPYVLDLHENVSVVRKLLNAKLDVWMIDWGYPKRADRFYRISDYVEYIDRCIDLICRRMGVENVTLHGYCLGATLSAIYTSINPERVRNLVLQAAPINFDTNNVLSLWAKNVDARRISETIGNATGDFLNMSFLLVDPIRLTVGKYQALLDRIDDRSYVRDFLHMDSWIFDSPAIPGKVYEEYIEEWYQKNSIVKGEYAVNGRKVDLRNIKMPVLVLVAERDHITPPDAIIPFFDAIPSDDKLLLSVDKGHIGLSVSRKAHEELWSRAVEWIIKRSG